MGIYEELYTILTEGTKHLSLEISYQEDTNTLGANLLGAKEEIVFRSYCKLEDMDLDFIKIYQAVLASLKRNFPEHNIHEKNLEEESGCLSLKIGLIKAKEIGEE